MTFAISFLLPKMRSYFAIFSRHSSYSFCNARISSPISLYRRISKIACAWRSVKFNPAACFFEASDLNWMPSVLPFTRQSFAIFKFLLPRRISIIKSIISQALINPSLISLLSSSLFKRVVYLRVAISYWKSIWCLIICFKPSVSGLPSTIASILTPNASSSFVFLYNTFFKYSTSAFFFNSSTMRIPSLEEALEISTTSVIFFVSIKSTTSEINFPIFAPIMVYGISVITSLSRSERFAAGSNSTLPRSLILPFPVS